MAYTLPLPTAQQVADSLRLAAELETVAQLLKEGVWTSARAARELQGLLKGVN